MASAFIRSSSIRRICSSFNSRFLAAKFHTVPEESLRNTPLAGSQYELLRPFPTTLRFLCTSAANSGASKPPESSANVNVAATQAGASAEGSAGNKNDGDQSSGGSENTQQQGKSVRGGVFLTLFAFFVRIQFVFHVFL